MRTKVVSALMRLYPKAWRTRYGPELVDMLRARPLTAKVGIDVVRSALWQRVRTIQTPTWVGMALMLVTINAIAWNIVAPTPYAWSPGQSPSEQPALSDRVELLQRPLHSEFYVLVLAGIGFWTAFRGNPRSGRAAIRVAMIAAVPIALIGLLMIVGVLDFVVLDPGQTPVPLNERGILYTVYKAPLGIPAPAPVAFLVSPLIRLPGAWMWGVIGGGLGRKFADWRRQPVSA